MNRIVLITIAIIIILASAASAQEITLKHTFFGGWKYSTDGENFKGVGMTGKSLCLVMEGNDEAIAEMKAFRKRKTWAAVIGWPGGFMVGWACGSAIADNWSDTDAWFLGIGIPMWLGSGLLESLANRHMKEAVSIYNGEDQSIMFDVNYRQLATSDNGQLTVGLKYTF